MIYLHIGNGKSGSTTIQAFLANNRSILEANSVLLPEVGMSSLAPVMSSVRSSESDVIRALSDFRDAVADERATFVFSSEFLFQVVRRNVLAHLRATTSKHHVKVIIYLRDYPSWIVSSYNQTIKHGKWILDFDDYFENKIRFTSVMPTIEAWADTFGKDNLHIRSIDFSSLADGRLTVDFAKTIGVFGLQGLDLNVETRNASEDWYRAELRRALAGELGHLPVTARSKEFIRLNRWIRRLMPVTTTDEPAGKVQYLTRRQWELASELYNLDRGRICSEFPSAVVAPLVGKEPPERDFLPSVERIPEEVRYRLARAAQSAARDHMLVEDAELFANVLAKTGVRASDAQEEFNATPPISPRRRRAR